MKKRCWKFGLALILLTTVFALVTMAVAAETDGYYTYTVTNGEATITDVDTAISGDITIPSTLGGYPVTAIGQGAFGDCRNLKSITVQSADILIYDYADTIAVNTVIYGYKNSSADTYASKYNRTFVALDKTYVPGDIDGQAGVDTDDAIYLLYHVIFGSENYPLRPAEHVIPEPPVSAEDQRQADRVIDLIEQIEQVTAENFDNMANAINHARASYDALTDTQKALISAELVQKLMDAEEAYAIFAAAAAKANEVIALINEIGEVTLDNWASSEREIQAARHAYDVLTELERSFVGEDNLRKLTAAEALADSGIHQTMVMLIEQLQHRLNEQTYTQGNMAALNHCLSPYNIVVFQDGDDADSRLDEIKGDSAAIERVEQAIEVALLRQLNVEGMRALRAALEASLAVPTFESSFAALKADLYGLGDLYVVGDYDGANGAFKADKYAANSYYHEQPVAKNSAVQLQIVTLADKAGFHAFSMAHDALLAEYYADNTYATGADGWIVGLNAYYVYEISINVMGNVTKDLQLVVPTAAAPANSVLVGQTVVTDFSYLAKVYLNQLKENEILVSPLYPIDVDALNASDVTTDWKATARFQHVIDDLNMQQNGMGTWMSAYTLVYAQLNYVQALADYTNNMFRGGVTTDANNIFANEMPVLAGSFLQNVVYANTRALQSKQYSAVTDAEFLTALTGAMCEPVSNSPTAQYSYLYYLLDDINPVVQTFRMANGQAYDSDCGGFDRWALYERMMDKSFELLWDKYKAKAHEWANIILKDYISVVYEAKYNTPRNVSGPGAIAVCLYNKTDLVAAMNRQGAGLTTSEPTTADELTDGFLRAFLLGDDLGYDSVYGTLGLTRKFRNSNLLEFYLNNGEAFASTTRIGDTAASLTRIYANPLASIAGDAENIRQRLTGAMLYTELKIAQADVATYKAMGVPVQQVFYGMLRESIENLDEIYARFLFEDYKKMTYNEMAVKAEKLVTFYNKGVDNAPQTAAIKRYLTGVADSYSYETGIKVSKDANGRITSLTYKANDMEASLVNGYLISQISPIVVDLWALVSASGTEKVAAVGMARVDEIAAATTATIENMLIKANFLNYLYEARGDIAAANITYRNYLDYIDPAAWAIKNELTEAINVADDQITISEFYYNRGNYQLSDYKTAYIENVLNLVADKDNLHVALLSGRSIDEIVALDMNGQQMLAEKTFANMLKAVRSSADRNWVVGKFSPYATSADYDYVGTYAVSLDEIINTMEGRVTTYRDASGTVQSLY